MSSFQNNSKNNLTINKQRGKTWVVSFYENIKEFYFGLLNENFLLLTLLFAIL